ncbi:MAG: hypothetical protein AAF485_28615, partial [Chloroflexota bacterium]
YLAGPEDPADPAQTLGLLTLNTAEDSILLNMKANEGLAFPMWSPHLDHPTLAILTGPILDGGELHLNRLLTIQPESLDTSSIVTEVAGDEMLGTPIFCPDGSLLYRVARDGHYVLETISPGASPQILFERIRPFRPVVCF